MISGVVYPLSNKIETRSMKYTSHVNYRDRRKHLFFLRLFLFVLFVAITCGAAYVYYSIVVGKSSSVQQDTTSQTTSSHFARSINIFRSPYFQFQANETWAEVPTESTANKYVYRSLRHNLIEHELVIYVDQIPANLAANRVLPVTFTTEGTELTSQAVSEHCVTALGNASRSFNQQVTVNNVSMLCDSDSTNYTVFAGVAGGTTNIQLKRPSGLNGSYTFLYTNLRAIQDTSQFSEIINSFQAR